jgi:hypothetical protein
MEERAMPIDSEALADELRRLRKNRAMLNPKLSGVIGPQTRHAFGVEESDNVAVIRRKATARIDRLLPDDAQERLRTAALAALALLPQTDQRNLTDREIWLAEQLNCDKRTARRRVTTAFSRLVDSLVEDDYASHLPERPRDDGFMVRLFRATMRLDTQPPELYEQRTILVTADRLDAIICRLTVPRTTPTVARNNVGVRALAGGRITGSNRRSAEHFEFTLEPPHPLQRGDVHEYCLVFTIPIGQPMRPHYVFQPLVPCERFELTVRFDPTRLPTSIWWVDGVAPRLLDADPPDADDLRPDRDGALHRTFTGPRQGMAYGVRWWPPPAVRQ